MELPWERGLASRALGLGAREVDGWSKAETALVKGLSEPDAGEVARLRNAIQSGEDPLGESFCALRPREDRRKAGATYTPPKIVEAMLRWACGVDAAPGRVVDPGVGSARFLVAAGRRFPDAELVGIELDPLAALVARGHLAAAGLASRAKVIVRDYREVALPSDRGRTLFIGNPPYVRHHLIESEWKEWLTAEAQQRDLPVSQLAGLHVHFFLATLLKSQKGDFGTFVTAAEWLDVNYGKLVRELFLGGLGGSQLIVIEPTALPFPDAATTAAITCFKIESRPKSIFVQRVKKLDNLGNLSGGMRVRRERLEGENRWSHLTRRGSRPPKGWVELGELCRVHRGQVTGANKVWIDGPHSSDLPKSVLFPSVTKARELYSAGHALSDSSALRRVIDLPGDLDELTVGERRRVESFLKKAKSLGGADSYIARNRRAWWSVGLREPAPILATYMARRPPAFVRNRANARHINIAHGLYPRDPLSEGILSALVRHLATTTSTSQGRTYAGGLTKFEPREMERIAVPAPSLLNEAVANG